MGRSRSARAVSAACALLLFGYALAWLWTFRPTRRVACVVGLGCFLLGGGVHTWRLVRDGRGQYRSALQYVVDRTDTAVVTVSSDHDLRNFAVIDYYARTVTSGRTIQYYAGAHPPPGGPQWLFFHHFEDDPSPDVDVYDKADHHYRLQRVFPHAALSGWDWYVYRNMK